jgi:hypothetical protein
MNRPNSFRPEAVLVIPGQPLCPSKFYHCRRIVAYVLVYSLLSRLYSLHNMDLAFVFISHIISHFIRNGISVDHLGMVLVIFAVLFFFMRVISRVAVSLFRFLWLTRPLTELTQEVFSPIIAFMISGSPLLRRVSPRL